MSRYQAALLPGMLCALLHTRSVNLLEREVDFVIRVRCNHTIKRADGRALSLARRTRNQAKGTTRVYEQVPLYEGPNTVFVHLICHRASQWPTGVFGHDPHRFR